ncbi:MAG TPA: cupin domain-containing protein [Candidatus Kapabacteria bacterium]|nr:cupin domain-containing protein [Candidatus Kapabacteria bacterium]
MEKAHDITLLPADAIETIHEEWGTLQWLAGSHVGNAEGVTVGRMTMRPGGSNALHSHANCEEVLLVLRGLVEQVVGGRSMRQRPGDVVVVPAGVPHRSINIGAGEAEVMIAFGSGARAFTYEQ